MKKKLMAALLISAISCALAVPALAEIAGVKDIDALYKAIHTEKLSYEGMSSEEILFSDYKEYEAYYTRDAAKNGIELPELTKENIPIHACFFESDIIEENKKELFYEEVERAAWTYLSDRLSIPTANLNKENIYDILRSKHVNDAIINALNNVLSTAEFARYAPSNDEHAMEDLYNKTAQIIDQLENQKL